jgi:hypothetical protein
MPALQDNLNRLAGMLRDEKDKDERARRLFAALAARSIDWPPNVRAALEIEGLHDNVLHPVSFIGLSLVGGEAVDRADILSLRRRVRRYHDKEI